MIFQSLFFFFLTQNKVEDLFVYLFFVYLYVYDHHFKIKIPIKNVMFNYQYCYLSFIGIPPGRHFIFLCYLARYIRPEEVC